MQRPRSAQQQKLAVPEWLPPSSHSRCALSTVAPAMLLRRWQVVFNRERVRVLYSSSPAVGRAPEGHGVQSCAGARLRGERLPKRAPLHGVSKVIGFRYSVGGTNAEQWERRIGIVEPPLDQLRIRDPGVQWQIVCYIH